MFKLSKIGAQNYGILEERVNQLENLQKIRRCT
jgi:hypothetical protein